MEQKTSLKLQKTTPKKQRAETEYQIFNLQSEKQTKNYLITY